MDHLRVSAGVKPSQDHLAALPDRLVCQGFVVPVGGEEVGFNGDIAQVGQAGDPCQHIACGNNADLLLTVEPGAFADRPQDIRGGNGDLDHRDVTGKVGQNLGQKPPGEDDVGIDLCMSGIGVIHNDLVHDIGFRILLFMETVVLAEDLGGVGDKIFTGYYKGYLYHGSSSFFLVRHTLMVP